MNQRIAGLDGRYTTHLERLANSNLFLLTYSKEGKETARLPDDASDFQTQLKYAKAIYSWNELGPNKIQALIERIEADADMLGEGKPQANGWSTTTKGLTVALLSLIPLLLCHPSPCKAPCTSKENEMQLAQSEVLRAKLVLEVWEDKHKTLQDFCTACEDAVCSGDKSQFYAVCCLSCLADRRPMTPSIYFQTIKVTGSWRVTSDHFFYLESFIEFRRAVKTYSSEAHDAFNQHKHSREMSTNK